MTSSRSRLAVRVATGTDQAEALRFLRGRIDERSREVARAEATCIAADNALASAYRRYTAARSDLAAYLEGHRDECS